MTEKQLNSLIDYIDAAIAARLEPLCGPIERSRSASVRWFDAENDLRRAFKFPERPWFDAENDLRRSLKLPECT